MRVPALVSEPPRQRNGVCRVPAGLAGGTGRGTDDAGVRRPPWKMWGTLLAEIVPLSVV